MGENELYQIAFHFREAIVAAKTNEEFNFRDRMHRFPCGCCDDTGAWKSVYVGQKVGNYKKMSRIITQDNFDIRKQSRLWDDYNIILKYLKNV